MTNRSHRFLSGDQGSAVSGSLHGLPLRDLENNGRFWLASYLVPLGLGLIGATLHLAEKRQSAIGLLHASDMMFLVTLLTCSFAAAVLGLLSIMRRETNSFYAYQTFICGFLVFLFAFAWTFM